MVKLSPLEQTLHQQFSDYGRSAREWTRRCILLLPEIDRRQVWRKKKFSSIYEYAAKLAGMSHATVDEALRVLRRLADKPSLLALVADKGLQRVRPVAAIATPETENFWVEKVKSMGKNALETYVHDYRLEILPREKTQPENNMTTVDLPSKVAQRFKQAQKRPDFDALLEKFLDQLEHLDEPEAHRSSSRYIPKAIKDFVGHRSGGKCSYPSCKRASTSVHHTQRFALEKVHDPARLRPLCTAHERLAHLGLIKNEDLPPDRWYLKEAPDKTDSKFFIDTIVARFRPT